VRKKLNVQIRHPEVNIYFIGYCMLFIQAGKLCMLCHK